jgi:hypothetical protein
MQGEHPKKDLAISYWLDTLFQKFSPNKLVFFLQTIITRGVPHCGLAIYIKKNLKAKEEFWKLKYFTMQKI